MSEDTHELSVIRDLIQRARDLGVVAINYADDIEDESIRDLVDRIVTAPNLPAHPFRVFEPAPGMLAAVGPRCGDTKGRAVLAVTLDDPDRTIEVDGALTFSREAGKRVLASLARTHSDLLDARALETQSASFTRHLAQSYDNMSLLYRLGRSMNELRHPEQFVTGAVEGLCDTLGYLWTAAWFRPGLREVGDLAGKFIASDDDTVFDGATLRSELESVVEKINRSGIAAGELSAGIYGAESCIGPEVVLQPVRIDGVYAGFLAMGNKRGEDPQATSYDTQALEAVAGYVGTLLESVHLYTEQQSTMMGMLRALTASLDAKDRYTRGHSERVALLGKNLALAVGMSQQDADRIHVSGILHDIGKIGVPDHVLCKPARLTDEEFGMIKRHPRLGHDILRGIPAVHDVLPGVLYHHERWDGRGYPEGLAGTEIPMMARVLSLADTFDSMSSNRAYRAARSRDQVLDEVRRCAGSQFDPDLAEAFLQLDFGPFDDLIAKHSRERVETQEAFGGDTAKRAA